MLLRLAAAIALPLSACTAAFADPVPAVAAAQGASPLYALELTALDGTSWKASKLAGKTVLFVNVASKCGFTPQYEGLQALYEARKDKGFVIVGQPSNQFMGQEPGTADEIESFCKMNYGVTFPLLAKADVNGGERTPLYTWLVDSPIGGGKKIAWNFEKFVVSPEGEVVGRFSPKTAPDDPSLVALIDKQLAP